MIQPDGFGATFEEFKAQPAFAGLTDAQFQATWAEIVARREAGDMKTPVYKDAETAVKQFETVKDWTAEPPPTTPIPPIVEDYIDAIDRQAPDTTRTGELTPQAQWRILGYDENDVDTSIPPPKDQPFKTAPEGESAVKSKYELMKEIAETALDEAEIPEADGFRPWFMARLSKYWLNSSNTYAFAKAEDDYEESEHSELTPTEKAAVDTQMLKGSVQEELATLKAQLAAQNEALQKQLIANTTLNNIQALPAGEQREKSLEDFVKNVLPTLLAVGGAGAGILAGGGYNLLTGGAGKALSGMPLGGGQAPPSRTDQLMELMMMMMMQQMGLGGKQSRGYSNYRSNYRKRSYSGYRNYRYNG